jgi:TetR/AcrR family transcriptional regulator, mexJK operon transcriptional repressor
MTIDADQGIRRGRKFDQVLEGAREVFLRDGFERAAVDDIARAARVSKATIYAYFPDKRLMFLEVARAECRRQTEAAEAAIVAGAPVREMLTIAAERLAQFVTSDFGQRIFRIIAGESERFPGLGREFFETGPGVVHALLVHHLGSYVRSGQLQIDDLDLAADQFAQLCKTRLQDRLLFGMAETVGAEDARRVITGAVDMFLARYGTAG